MSSKRCICLTVIACVASVCCRSAPRLATVTAADADPRPILFRDVSVFDGVTMLRHRDVLVTGAEVEAVVDTGALALSARTLELAGAGRTLMPGLVDSHAHLFSAGEKRGPPPDADTIGRAFLFAGVTSVLVAAGFDETTQLRRRQRNGTAVAPHLYTAGPGLSAPDGHPIPLLRAMLPWPAQWFATRGVPTAADGAEARARVRDIVTRDRPDFVKIAYDDLPPGSPHLSLGALRAAIAEARARGVRALVHATTPDDAMDAIAAGAALLAYVPQRGLLTDEQVARIADSGVPVVTTVRLVSASHDLAARGPGPLETTDVRTRAAAAVAGRATVGAARLLRGDRPAPCRGRG